MGNDDDNDDIVFTVHGDAYALVPPGSYEVAYVKKQKRRFRGTWKVYVWFQIISGEYHGTRIFRAYNYYNPLKRASDLYKDLAMIFGGNAPRGYQLPLKLFENRVLTVKVRTVEKDCKQTALALYARYSVVEQILSVDTKC